MAKKKARTPPNGQKITDEQCIEVVRRYVDEGESVTELAEAYGVSRTAIYNALHRAEFADRMKELREARLATAQLRILEQAEKALDRNEDILNTEYDPAYQYLWQNASRDVLDRAGIKAPKEDKQDISISFAGGGFEVNMPEDKDE
jgi:transposase-like protein